MAGSSAQDMLRAKPGLDNIDIAATPQIFSTAAQTDYASNRLNTSVALVPPKPNEFDIAVPILALSIRLRTIGISANTGSSSVMLALSQMKPLFIIRSE